MQGRVAVTVNGARQAVESIIGRKIEQSVALAAYLKKSSNFQNLTSPVSV